MKKRSQGHSRNMRAMHLHSPVDARATAGVARNGPNISNFACASSTCPMWVWDRVRRGVCHESFLVCFFRMTGGLLDQILRIVDPGSLPPCAVRKIHPKGHYRTLHIFVRTLSFCNMIRCTSWGFSSSCRFVFSCLWAT